jgi:hypothetical protein
MFSVALEGNAGAFSTAAAAAAAAAAERLDAQVQRLQRRGGVVMHEITQELSNQNTECVSKGVNESRVITKTSIQTRTIFLL